jgi:broad specificity phosphatase PhoE
VAERLTGSNVQRVFTSPLERARETAKPIALALGTPVEVAEDYTDIDFGQWTGKCFPELSGDPVWRRFNTFRATTPIPGGETIAEVQRRSVEAMLSAIASFPGATLAFVGHADPMRAVLAYFAGIPIDMMLRLRIDTGSVSVIEVDQHAMTLSMLNTTKGAIMV